MSREVLRAIVFVFVEVPDLIIRLHISSSRLVHVGISDTQRYKCLSNAVTVNVISTIVSELL
jgi:site-specific DNA-cytosine methylase